MADLEAVIAGAVAEARDGGDVDGGGEPVVEAAADIQDPVVEGEPADRAADDGAEKPAEVVANDKTPKSEEKVADPAEAFAAEHGIKAKDTMGRENRIPFSRVQKINANAVTKAEAKWVTEKLAPVEAKVKEYEGRLEGIGKIEHMMFNDHKRFLDVLRTIPGYKDLLSSDGKPADASGADAAITSDLKAELAALGAEPGPDTADGFSAKGLSALLSWTAKKATIEATMAAEARLGKRIEPFEKRVKDAETETQRATRTTNLLNDAQSWPGFTEHAPAILKVMQDDKALKHTLESAYREVVYGVLGKTKEDEKTITARIRKELLEELNKAPKSTAGGGSGAVNTRAQTAAAKDSPRSLSDVVRDAAREKGLLDG